jgi:hypothetical protein
VGNALDLDICDSEGYMQLLQEKEHELQMLQQIAAGQNPQVRLRIAPAACCV